MRRSIRPWQVLSVTLGIVLAVSLPACRSAATSPVNKTPAGVAIKGFDPVAYFLDGRPVPGSEAFAYQWTGAEWRFADARHRDLFREDPEKYAPRYGGYCAFAVSIGRTADIDPEQWTIVDGKLYLNLDQMTKRTWEQDIPGNIKKGDKNWPGIAARGSR